MSFRDTHTEPPAGAPAALSQGLSSAMVITFAATIFLGAFLLFQIQPMSSKAILPWYGGTPNVWTTCMLFFQCLLFAGYAYAHLTRKFLSPRSQGIVHVVLLLVALIVPILPGDAWRPDGTENPTLDILGLLTAHVGLPYFLLASTSPLIQAWWESRAAAGSCLSV